MASLCNIPDHRGLGGLATELVIKIMEELSPSGVSNLALVNKRLLAIFIQNKNDITIKMLKARPEFQTMLYLCTSHYNELQCERFLYARNIDFHCGEFKVNLMRPDRAIKVLEPMESYYASPWKVFGQEQVLHMWNMTKVIDWWVEIYPSLRWRDSPTERRCLRADEEGRLRKAVANWWLYAHYHHGLSFRFRNNQEPKRLSKDTRLHAIRRLSTAEISELSYLWLAVSDTVSKDLCSSPERVCRCRHGYAIDIVPWGADQGRHDNIVQTYMKLDPSMLRGCLSGWANWKKIPTIHAVSNMTQQLSRDMETLSISMQKVMQERLMVINVNSGKNAIIPPIGILDEDRPSKADIAPWVDDGWVSGRVPMTADRIKLISVNQATRDPSTRLPRGDDGSERQSIKESY
ncbi:hypothetical protein F4677DRAFT_124642 [Hypoxylon crocopeplum]|nr:hypothetical protein F4677DRAFT_124642 [Hypoxylon crocopeplum]